MAAKFKVTCVCKRDRENPYEKITHIGVSDGINKPRYLRQEQAIFEIESGKSIFEAGEGENIVEVIVAEKDNKKYIKTIKDEIIPNNLLSLPECPILGILNS